MVGNKAADWVEGGRLKSSGPFSTAKPADWDTRAEMIGPVVDAVKILDASGNTFAVVFADDCVGHDRASAKARATRIAESLNRTDKMREALGAARSVIQEERDVTVECATSPPDHDLATLNADTKPFVDDYDRVLALIDEALA